MVEVLARANGLAQLGSMTHYKRQLTAIEALQIYVPLAHALGMAATAAEMEDRCFKVRQRLCPPMLFGNGCSRSIMAGACAQGRAWAFLKTNNAHQQTALLGLQQSSVMSSQGQLYIELGDIGTVHAAHTGLDTVKGDATAEFALAYGPCRMQELFPESYAETAAWLSRQLDQAGNSLEACRAALQAALEGDAVFMELAAGCQVWGSCITALHLCTIAAQSSSDTCHCLSPANSEVLAVSNVLWSWPTQQQPHLW